MRHRSEAEKSAMASLQETLPAIPRSSQWGSANAAATELLRAQEVPDAVQRVAGGGRQKRKLTCIRCR